MRLNGCCSMSGGMGGSFSSVQIKDRQSNQELVAVAIFKSSIISSVDKPIGSQCISK